ncbi:MAG: HPr family phosphocarrier protein, partial [Caldilineae bacterium]
MEQAGEAIAKRRHSVAARLGAGEAAIFDAHILILEDPDLLECARKGIFEEHKNAAAAWQTAIEKAAAAYEDLKDAYLQQRAVDVRDVGRQVLLI